jgi:hypothetical protein
MHQVAGELGIMLAIVASSRPPPVAAPWPVEPESVHAAAPPSSVASAMAAIAVLIVARIVIPHYGPLPGCVPALQRIMRH